MLFNDLNIYICCYVYREVNRTFDCLFKEAIIFKILLFDGQINFLEEDVI